MAMNPARDRPPLQGADENAALRHILEGTATATGARFFAALVESLAGALNTRGALVTEYIPEARRLRSLAFWMDGEWIRDYEYDIAGTPCEAVITECRLVHHPENVAALFPLDTDLARLGAVSYMAAPLADVRGGIIGNLVVLDPRPLPAEPRYEALIRIFAARAAAELERIRAEGAVREREAELSGLVQSAMDAIIQLDESLRVVRANPAAEKVYRRGPDDFAGADFSAFLTAEAFARLAELARGLAGRRDGPRRLWIPGGLEAVRAGGEVFAAEATLSRFEHGGKGFYTLILRDVNERLEAERKIRSLESEAEYLREELRALGDFGDIAGRSEPVLRVLEDIEQVASTDSTVLVLGETGTGKELVARAIHSRSRRRDGPLVKVNCAAIPAQLIESELFGHEKGAFTGATERRDGRFTLADAGTIFLDEVGELPLDLQAKLLRVLQEGELEPVGSSRTRKVDVRVIAATNRDLERAAAEGAFRQDLYYRLNVFPIRLPPLRERGGDIAILAEAFVKKLARKLGKRIEPLADDSIRRLEAYRWPGNVRELQNVIERAIITSRDGRLNLDRALPESAAAALPAATPGAADPGADRILRAEEVQALERSNVLRALEASGWRVAGKGGAAEILGLNPSTLQSRLRALGIERPRASS
jgi:PAS domain S-box-containing protein